MSINSALLIIACLSAKQESLLIPFFPFYFLGFLTSDEAGGSIPKVGLRGERFIRKSCLVGGLDQLDVLNHFVRGALRSHLVTVAMHLNQVVISFPFWL